MKVANAAVFSHLSAHCARRGDPIVDPTAGRYVNGDEVAQETLKHLQWIDGHQFSQRRSVSRWKHGTLDIFVTIGFEFEVEITQLTSAEPNPGLGVCVYSTILPQPTVSPATIRNVVEVGKVGELAYTGHDFEALRSLFPRIQVFAATAPIDATATWRTFLAICLNECRLGESWINDELADELLSLTDLNVPSLPYRSICRSLFEFDPRSLFMSLYRCIEATYAYESCRKLVTALGLQVHWSELAKALDAEVGWHPPEASSLNLILKYALPDDLIDLCGCLAVAAGEDPAVSAGRAIYRMRNRTVHFRPDEEAHEFDGVDWNRLCLGLVRIVFSVFSHAHAATA